MKAKNYLFSFSKLILGVIFLSCLNLQAQVVKTSQTTGNWNSITWSPAGVPSVSNNAVVNRRVVIPIGTTVEINDLEIAKDGILVIEGTLKVNGNLVMSHNNSIFEMGSTAYVIVKGNFSASNQVSISISSFLIIHGNFTKTGASTQGELLVDGGNIYIFGTVDEDWREFQTCPTYEGNTGAIERENCDYGTEQEYIDNYENFPPELQELKNCYTISIEDKAVCESQSATFSIDPIADVNYQWQVKLPSETNWIDIGTNAPSFTIPIVNKSMDGNSYRVVIKSKNSNSDCKVSVSKVAFLGVKGVDFNIGSISGPTSVCAATANINYTIPTVENATYSWNFPAGWYIISGNATNSVMVRAEENASSGTIGVTITNDCKSEQVTLEVSIDSRGKWTGTADTNWNNPENWSCNSLPTLQTNVLIPGGVTRYPVISTGDNALTKDLEIEAGASIHVSHNWIRIAGNFTNSGSLNATAGSISFEGNVHQTIPANAWNNASIRNLKIDNPGGVSSRGRIEVLNSLKVEEGIFETGDDLVLVSNTSGTAFIDGSGNGQISGTVTMQRYLSNAFGYKYFSTPFQNTSVADLAANFDLTDPDTGFPHLYEYVEGRKDTSGNDLTGWQKYLEPTASLNPGAGYAINPAGENAPLTIKLSGAVNDGAITIELQNSNGTYTNGFNLVGNPYPSPIDWEKIDLTGIDEAIHFFTSSSEDRYTGTYNTYVNGVSTRGIASNIIPSMQGFFVRVSDPKDENYPAKTNLIFTNAARTGNEVKQEYYKNKNKPEVPKMRFSASFKGRKGADAMVLYFTDGATANFENNLDAQKMLNTAVNVPNFYSLSSKGEKLSINAIPGESSEKMEIPLGISTERSGEIVLTLLETINIFPSQHIYLKDKKKNLLQNLNEDPEYSFTSQKGEINDRFSLILSSEKLSDNELRSSLDHFSVHAGRGEILVKLNLSENTSGNIIMSSISGQVLQQKPGKGNDEIRFSGSLIAGIYLVTLETEKEIRTKKVIFKN